MNFPVAVLCCVLAQAMPASHVRGVVLDATGAPIQGATVRLGSHSVATDARGAFVVPVGDAPAELRVTAAGFAEHVAHVQAGRELRITLHPAALAESVTVTVHRSLHRLADTATATSVFSAPVLLTAASLTIDDALRTVPGFSLFRRSSSRVANPTTQGATLRGLSASGASRVLVLADGVPLNDPYGGWVYWNRVPLMAIDRIEVVRGGATEALYGNQSIGGAAQIVMVEPSNTAARASLEAGQHEERRASLYVGSRRGAFSGFVAGEPFFLGGFPIVAAGERGPIDVNASLRYSSAIASAGWSTTRWGVAMRGNWLDEERGNGTPLQRNDTELWTVALRGRVETRLGPIAYNAFGGGATYNQSFSFVNADRTSENLTRVQHVPSEHAGGSLQWFGAWGRHSAMAGADLQRVSGGGAPADSGSQGDYAGFAQVQARPTTATTVTAGLRAGAWSTSLNDAVGFERTLFYLRPRISVAWAVREALSLSASWSNPGRTPSLNELYRDFQVGNTLTGANPHLDPENAQSFEAGALLRRGGTSARVVAFWTSLDDAVTNVTVGTAGRVIVRQRRNAGRIRARGVEVEADWRLRSWAAISGSATWIDSRFTRSLEPGLEGKRVSQVPRPQGRLSLRLTPGRAVATVDWRGTGAQFDDDRNAFELRGAHVLDLYAAASLARGFQPFVAIENLFDAEVDVGRTPVRTVGTPRSVRVGLRLFIP